MPVELAPVPAPALAPGRQLFNRILLPADASDQAARAIEHAIALWRNNPAQGNMDIHLMNVQRELSGDVARFVPKESVQDYHRERSEKALARARRMLDEAGVKYAVHAMVGKPWEVISDYAAKNQFDLVVMGTRAWAPTPAPRSARWPRASLSAARCRSCSSNDGRDTTFPVRPKRGVAKAAHAASVGRQYGTRIRSGSPALRQTQLCKRDLLP